MTVNNRRRIIFCLSVSQLLLLLYEYEYDEYDVSQSLTSSLNANDHTKTIQNPTKQHIVVRTHWMMIWWWTLYRRDKWKKNRPTRAINAFHKHFIRSSLFVLVKNIPRVPATIPKISPTNFITISITSAGWGSIKWTVGIHKITTKYLISSWFYGVNSGIGDNTILIDHSILSLWWCTYVRSWLLSSNPTNASHLFAEPRWKPLRNINYLNLLFRKYLFRKHFSQNVIFLQILNGAFVAQSWNTAPLILVFTLR